MAPFALAEVGVGAAEVRGSPGIIMFDEDDDSSDEAADSEEARELRSDVITAAIGKRLVVGNGIMVIVLEAEVAVVVVKSTGTVTVTVTQVPGRKRVVVCGQLFPTKHPSPRNTVVVGFPW